jgi:anti-sigma regulatory factor (Ser/Thr protein kinase)
MDPGIDSHAAAVPREEGALLRLTLANERAMLESTRLAVVDFLTGRRLSARTVFGVELILEEVLTNMIKYAFSDGARHMIDVSVQIDPDQVVMQFEDGGLAFDPLRATAPATPPTSLDNVVPGGLGLVLLRKFAKTVAYERRDSRNRLTVAVARDQDR